MLRDIYDMFGIERRGRTVGVADLVSGGLFSAVATGASYHIAKRYCYVLDQAASGGERGGDEEKTPHGLATYQPREQNAQHGTLAMRPKT